MTTFSNGHAKPGQRRQALCVVDFERNEFPFQKATRLVVII